jgi:hypothetical protein
MADELNNQVDEELHLKDVTEAGELPTEIPRSRKKKLMMFGCLAGLLIVAGLGGYWLLTGKQVQVKAMRRAGEKLTSGTDLQQAAFDSLKGSLDAPVTNPSDISATNIGAGQPSTIAMAGVMPSVPTMTKSDPGKTIPPVQSGIAMTIAPPPEVTKQVARSADTIENNQSGNHAGTKESPALSMTTSKPKTASSISFTVPKNKTEMVAPPVLTKTTLETNREAKSVVQSTRTNTMPTFGAMLPVKLIGVLYTLRTGSMARLELTRDLTTANGFLKRGTIFVGTVQGAELDRAFVQIKGLIDPATNSFMKLEGELLGSDGGAGLRGKRRSISSAWSKVLDRTAQAGTQILNGLLGRRGGSVIVATDPYGTYRSTRNDPSSRQDNRTFVEVTAGSVGFILITTLPSEKTEELLALNRKEDSTDISDEEVAMLLTQADPAEIRAALPRMNPALRQVAQAVLRELEASK